MLVYIIIFELVKNNQHEELQKNFLTKKLERKPEDIIKCRDATCWTTVAALYITLFGWVKHIVVPVLPCKVGE